MSARPWYKRYPSDFIAGTLGLSAEQKGVYGTLLDLMYDRGAAIADAPVELARISGCSTRRFNIIKAQLVERGKLILRDGLISNARFEHQSGTEKREHDQLSKNGRKSSDKSDINARKPAEKTEINSPRVKDSNDLTKKGLPPLNPAVQNPESRVGGGGGGARAREAVKISPEAFKVADEILLIAGHTKENPPLRWMTDQPALRMQMMLDTGWRPEVMRDAATNAMRHKRDGPPSTIRWFEPIFARAHAPPLPLPSAQIVHNAGGGFSEANRPYAGAPRGEGFSARAMRLARLSGLA